MGSRLSAMTAARSIFEATTINDQLAVPIDIALGRSGVLDRSAPAMRCLMVMMWLSQRHLRTGERMRMGVDLAHLRDAAGYGYSKDLDVIVAALRALEGATMALAVMPPARDAARDDTRRAVRAASAADHFTGSFMGREAVEDGAYDRPAEYRKVALFDEIALLRSGCRFVFSEDVLSAFADLSSRYALISIADLAFLPKAIDGGLYLRTCLFRRMRTPQFRVLDGDFGVVDLVSGSVSRALLRRAAARVGKAAGCALDVSLERQDPALGARSALIAVTDRSELCAMAAPSLEECADY